MWEVSYTVEAQQILELNIKCMCSQGCIIDYVQIPHYFVSTLRLCCSQKNDLMLKILTFELGLVLTQHSL